jgi:hypothetical protein
MPIIDHWFIDQPTGNIKAFRQCLGELDILAMPTTIIISTDRKVMWSPFQRVVEMLLQYKRSTMDSKLAHTCQ